jgi:hypothetical protein
MKQLEDLEAQCRNAKARGEARVSLSTNVIMQLVAQAKVAAGMSQIERDAARRMGQ